MTVSRRTVSFGLGAGLGAGLASAAPARAAFTLGGWSIDDRKLAGVMPPALAASVKAQLELVDSIAMKPEIKAFFRTIPMEFDPAQRGSPGLYGPGPNGRGRLILGGAPTPRENPVLLHELLHGYHHQKLPGAYANRDVLRFMDEAKKSGAFPAGAYMFTNPQEYFAMTASVVLWGKAARPPSTRAAVKQAQPACYGWILKEFGLTLA